MGDSKNKSFKTRHLIIIIVIAIVFFTIGILIGRFATCPDNEINGVVLSGVSDKIIRDADPDISNILIQSISAQNIEENLRYLSSKPHIAGEDRDFELVQYLKDKFNEYGMDSTMISPYEVLLSYPDRQRPNSAKIISLRDNSVIYDSLQGESSMSNESGVVRPFLAYSPSGSVQGELVYVNYGRVEDYVYLENNTNVNVTGKIVIARYGKIFRGSKVAIAGKRGAIGILIYSDPKDYTWPEEDTRVFPDTWWIPPDAVQRGTSYTRSGDPLTPGYPATRTAFRYNETEDQSSMPPIPVHAISYRAAEQFLSQLQGQEVPNDWKGGINVTYKFGPTNRTSVTVNLTTSTRNELRKVENVISIIKVEPDRYILFGNHRDAWIYGSIDPSSGTAAMMEVARAMGKLVKEGKWRPRRSIMFCSWGAEEYGLIGSIEYAEQYVKSLGSRAVAYINTDIAVEGNYSLRVLGAPLLYRPTFEATKKVSNPNKTEVTAGIQTVYDKWIKAFPWEGYNLPRVETLGSGSDYASMLQIVGITSVDLCYTYDSNKYKIGSYPLYHTEYETFNAVKTLLDKDFEGELVYVNYGRVEDYVYLENNTDVNVTGKIVIARYGEIFRGSQVAIAGKRGAIGILIYSDPKDYTWPEEDTRVFPDTWWIPPDAVQRGTTYTKNGDPLTPGYPATRTAFRYNETEVQSSMPPIPAHAISYRAAEKFLSQLQGQEVPNDWKGGINITYRFGPTNRTSVTVNLTTSTKNDLRKVENVISIIKGEVEPDRYVLFGNHRDAWIYGSIDPSSGTAVMMEVARAMGKLVKEGKWRPRRSIMFCSWGAEEYGLIGSNEYAEQYVKSLGSRAVAYINIDIAVEGNYSLRVMGAPLMYRPTFEATKKVSNPDKTEVNAGIRTVYDKWLEAFPWEGYNLPRVQTLGSGSDFASMLQIVGITSVDLCYTYDSYHQAIARVGAELLRSLADSLILPFNVSDYVWGLDLNRRTLHQEKGILLSQNVANYSELQNAITSFQKDVLAFEKAVASVNKQNPMATRMVNDQMHLLEKAFLNPAGLPGRSGNKHLLMAESSNDAYAGSSFPGLVDLLFEIDKLQSPELEQRWQQVNHHFSVIVNAIQAAGYTLRDVTKFIEEQY